MPESRQEKNRIEPRVVIVFRETRLDELKRRFNTVEQARFYVEHLGADFNDYVVEDNAYKSSLKLVRNGYQAFTRVQMIDRSYLSNYVFSGDETVVVVGQDGLVANTLKYTKELPVVGVNPEPDRYDGVLLPFIAKEMGKLARETVFGKRKMKEVTLARANLSNGQYIVGVNDIFIGPRQHSSARYAITCGSKSEMQSSSGIIISTGLGSTGWFQSLLTGANRIAGSMTSERMTLLKGYAWDAKYLYYCVREPFPSHVTGTELVFGRISKSQPLKIDSYMPENGMMFSDGMVDETIDFHAGLTATIGLADWQARLVV